MVFLFNRTGRRQPSDLVRYIKDLLLKLHESPDAAKVSSALVCFYCFGRTGESSNTKTIQIAEDLGKQLSQLRLLVQGTQGECFFSHLHCYLPPR